jgi:hypothetical protein
VWNELMSSYTKVTPDLLGYMNLSFLSSRRPIRELKMSVKLFGGSCCVNNLVMGMKG